MKAGMGASLGIKYLLRYKRRYLFLFLIIAFGFGIATLITGERDSMYQSVYMAAQGHYAGDLIVQGNDESIKIGVHMTKATIDTVLKAAKEAHLNPRQTVMRTIINMGGHIQPVLYYNGNSLNLMHLYGVDYANEKPYFNSLNYSEISPKGIDQDETIVLSKPSADALGVHMGDRVLLQVSTAQGAQNTAYFTVSAIYRDSSIFGFYKAYLSRVTLNKLVRLPSNECSIIGFYFRDSGLAEAKRQALYKALKATKLKVDPLPYTRDEWSDSGSEDGIGDEVVLVTIPVYLTEVSDMLDAINILSYSLFGVMLLIIFVSAMVTYNLILSERAKDIGTMRALGFNEVDVRGILYVEVLGAALFALLAGFCISLLGSSLVSQIHISGLSDIDAFLKNGVLTAYFKPSTLGINILAVFCALFLAIIPPTIRTSRSGIPDLITGGVKE